MGKMCSFQQTRRNYLHPIVISGIANFIRRKQTYPSEEKNAVVPTNKLYIFFLFRCADLLFTL